MRFAGPVVEGKRARKVLRGYTEDAAWRALNKRGGDDSDSEGAGRKRRRGGGSGDDDGWRSGG